MVRGALEPLRSRRQKAPLPFAAYLPAISVVFASLLSALPIITAQGWFPDFGFLVFLGWRLLRADPWPGWWAAPLGLVNDLFTGYPLGYSMALWCATMIVLDLADRRTMWRDYWVEWMLAAALIMIDEFFQWRLAGMIGGAPPLSAMLPTVVISILAFPVAAYVVGRLDSWRLGR